MVVTVTSGVVLVVKCGTVCGRFSMAEGVGVGGWFGWSVGSDGLVGGDDGRVVQRGAMCGADMCDLFLTAVRVVASFSFMINPPSMNFWIVCLHKDRGGSRRWPWCFRFYLFWWQTLRGHCVFVYFIVVVLDSDLVSERIISYI